MRLIMINDGNPNISEKNIDNILKGVGSDRDYAAIEFASATYGIVRQLVEATTTEYPNALKFWILDNIGNIKFNGDTWSMPTVAYFHSVID